MTNVSTNRTSGHTHQAVVLSAIAAVVTALA
jgi:hypothetical protein